MTGFKQVFHRIDTTLLLLLSAGIILVQFNERNSTFFLAWLLLLLLYCMFTGVLIYSFVRSYSTRSYNWLYIRFFPFILGLFFIPLLFLLSQYFKNGGFKSVVIEATEETSPRNIQLTLYKDSTFRLFHSGKFGGGYVRGNYKFIGDTLYMDTARLTSIYPIGKFILKKNEQAQEYIDPVANRSSAYFHLRVHTDKRPQNRCKSMEQKK